MPTQIRGEQIKDNAITNSKAAQMAPNTIQGNNSGSTANVVDLTATQATAMLDSTVGATGVANGTKGLVPQPLIANQLQFLRGDSTWATPASGGTTINNGALVYADGSAPAGNTVANTAVETALTSSYTIAGNSLVAGNVLRLRIAGVHSTDIAAPNITVKVKIGSVLIGNTGAVTLVAAVTNFGFSGYVDIIVTNAGATGTVESQGFIQFATGAVASVSIDLANIAAVTAIDFTAAQTITVTVQWGLAAAANTITMRQMEVDLNKVTTGGGGGSTTKGIAEVDFGSISQENDIATVTISDTAITATSYPSVTMYGLATVDHDPDDYLVEDLTPYVVNVVAGVGFDISVTAPNFTWGKYKVTYLY